MKKKGVTKHIYIVIDDGLGIFDFRDKRIVNLFVTSRHANITMFVMLQQLTGFCSGAIRNNVDYMFINKISDHSNIECLYKMTAVQDSVNNMKLYINKNCANYNTIFLNMSSINSPEPLIFNANNI